MEPINEHFKNIINDVAERVGVTEDTSIVFSSFDSSEFVMRRMSEKGIIFKVVLGRYNSDFEIAYVTNFQHLQWLLESGITDGQESILIGSADGVKSYLLYNALDGTGKPKLQELGTMKKITPEQAVDVIAWTYDPSAGLYYSTMEAA